MHRYSSFIAPAVLALLVSACGKDGTPEAPAKAGVAPDAKALQLPAVQKQFLTIETVGATQTADMIALPGRVTFRPQAQSAVGATAAGRVVAVLVQAGQVVKAGTPLLTIESADAGAARATRDQAVTRLATAESVYKRQVEMVDKGVGVESERHEADAKLKEARTEHARAQQAVDLLGAGQGSQISVRAPANGVVMSIRVAAGATVTPGGEALLELGDPTQLQVVAQVAESDLARIALGQEAEIELPALAARTAGRVENISPRIDPESRRMQVYFALTKRVDGLRAGMLAQINLRIGAEEGMSLPVSAVLIKDGKRRVVYVERADGSFEAREVKTGHNRNGFVVILEGLKGGEKVVVRGALLLDTQAEQLL